MELLDYIKDSEFPLWELLHIELYISEGMIPENNSSLKMKRLPPFGKDLCSLKSSLPSPESVLIP